MQVIYVDIYECKCSFKKISVSVFVVNITISNVGVVHVWDLIAMTFPLPFGSDTRINPRWLIRNYFMDFLEGSRWASVPRGGRRGWRAAQVCECFCSLLVCLLMCLFTCLLCTVPSMHGNERGAFCNDYLTLGHHHTHTHTYTHTQTDMHGRAHTQTHTYTHTYTHTRTHTQTHIHTQPLTTSMLYICSQFLWPEPNMIWIYIVELHAAVLQ